MKILVTGAHGFIGSHLCERLITGGRRVRALVSPWGNADNLRPLAGHPSLELVRSDITDPDDLRGVCQGVTAVVHAAARVADWGPAQPFMRTNVDGTRHLLAAAEESGVSRFVLVSSVAVHGFRGFRQADAEALPRDSTMTAYARSKIAAEDLVFAWPGEGTVIRPGLWPFGPRDPQLRRVALALRQGRLPLLDGGDRVLNTAFVGNLVIGLERAVLTPGMHGRAFVVADEGAPSWREVFAELARLIGARPPRLRLPSAAVGPVAAGLESLWSALAPGREPPLTRYRAALMRRDVHFSIVRTEEELGYHPQFSWRQGMRISVAEDEVLSRMAGAAARA